MKRYVNEADLVEALNNNVIAGDTALDVFENEPLPKDSVLYSTLNMSSKLLLTPRGADLGVNRYFPAAQQFGEYAKTFCESGGYLDHIKHWVVPAKGY